MIDLVVQIILLIALCFFGIRVIRFFWVYLLNAPQNLKEALEEEKKGVELKKIERETSVWRCIIASNDADFFMIFFLWLACLIKTALYIEPLTSYDVSMWQEIVILFKYWQGGEQEINSYLFNQQIKQGYDFAIRETRFMFFYGIKKLVIFTILLLLSPYWSFHDNWDNFKKLFSMKSSKDQSSFMEQGGHTLMFTIMGFLIVWINERLEDRKQNKRINFHHGEEK